ncbi:MAG: hypothetical protein RBQ97_10090 [Acholeplasma sp.]|nr:hypothetical protein [Acholeplasma sp.]
MSNSNILFIVEGEVTEPELIKKMNSVLNITETRNVYSYKTSIYELYDVLKEDKYLDIVLTLKERTSDKRTREMLSRNFVAIYLIFDFEPHYQKFDINKIVEMRKVFNESTDGGLLLINYPMIEAYKHIKEMPDKEFIDRTVTKKQVKQYKHLVGEESDYTDLAACHRDIIINQMIHHLIKMNYLINGCKAMPNYETVTKMIHDEEFIKKQHLHYQDDKLFVLSTVYYYILELKPTSFFDEIQLPNIINELCTDS